MTDLIHCHSSSVNRWECDENDHLNVRFFAQRMLETTQAGLLQLGIVTQQNLAEVMASLRSMHMRYLREARIAAPLGGWFGILDDGRLLAELRHPTDGQVFAAFVIRLDHQSLTAAAPSLPSVPMPAHAGGRGLPDAPPDLIDRPLADLRTCGFVPIGRGVIQPWECDPQGRLQQHLYIGRTSDALPHLWVHLSPPDDPIRKAESEGGAVLEYRSEQLGALRSGDRFEILSGVRDIAEKTQRMVHLMINSDREELVMVNEVLGITMDLKARKSIPIPEARREVLQQKRLRL